MDNREKIYEHGGELGNVQDLFEITANHVHYQIQTLLLNSTLTITNILSFREQTTGGFTDIRGSELVLFDIFDISKLTSESRAELLKLFEELSKVEFPSILDQYVSSDENRLKLDLGILSALGFDEEEAKQLLFPLYEAIITELKMKG